MSNPLMNNSIAAEPPNGWTPVRYASCINCMCTSVCKYKERYREFLNAAQQLAEDYDWPFAINVDCLVYKTRGSITRG